MLPYPIDVITEPNILDLPKSGVAEGRTLDFKRELPGGRDEDIKEFLADVTSLANTQGGDLVFGVEDQDGFATAICGVSPPSIDDAILRLENLMRDGVQPRLPSARIRWIPLTAGGGVLVVRVSASLAAPHRVTFKNSGRFHARNSRGKYEMDTHELRSAFTASEGLPLQLRALHASAGSKLPFRIFTTPRAVVSVMPITVLRERRDIDPSFENSLAPVKPSGALDWLHTIEGVVIHTPADPTQYPEFPVDFVRSYAVTHRRGYVDVAWAIGGERELRSGLVAKMVWLDPFERDLLGITISAVTRLKAFGVEGPWAVFVTIEGVEGYELVIGQDDYSRPAWRDGVALPEQVMEVVNEEAFLPIFKSIWLLFGRVRPPGRTLA